MLFWYRAILSNYLLIILFTNRRLKLLCNLIVHFILFCFMGYFNYVSSLAHYTPSQFWHCVEIFVIHFNNAMLLFSALAPAILFLSIAQMPCHACLYTYIIFISCLTSEYNLPKYSAVFQLSLLEIFQTSQNIIFHAILGANLILLSFIICKVLYIKV
jgi:hypothetical protein